MSAAHWSFIQAIYNALAHYEPIQAQNWAIYDHVPPEAQLPYITLGHSNERPWHTKTFDGSEHVITLDLWSRGPGRQELTSMMTLVRQAMQAFTMGDAFECILFQFEFSEILRDLEDDILHGILRYRATIQETAI